MRNKEEMESFQSVFPNGIYEDRWGKLFMIYDYFVKIANYVGKALEYSFDVKETEEVRMFLLERQKQSANGISI
ncbi:MAG: aminoglycoside 6-adenylyltransferase [Lachnospiraceae bacterium]|nr:aminoglycoside 6-adenylyltransferase [Lachnospiraceae bacterium]